MRCYLTLYVFAFILVVSPVQAQPVTVTGADGTSVTIDDTERIVTLGGAVTETVFALGLGAQVVAADASSLYPPEAQERPSVGYFRQVGAEGILSLRPTLVLASEMAGPPSTFQQVRSAGVPVLIVPDAPSVDGARAKIETLAEALGHEEQGIALIDAMQDDLDRARERVDRSTTKPRVLFVYARGSGSLHVAGTDNAAHAMIELAGAENAVTAYEGYRPLTAEAVVAAAPDVILMPELGLQSIGGIDGLLAQPGLALTPAGQRRRVVAMDDLLLTGFTPRLGEAVAELAQKLHPEVVAPEVEPE